MAFTSVIQLEFLTVELFVCQSAILISKPLVKLDILMAGIQQKIVTCLNLKVKEPKNCRKPEMSFSPETPFYSDLLACRF